MTKRALSRLNQWRSRVFAVETDAHAEPIYFALSSRPQPDGGHCFQGVFGGGKSYSLHLYVEDRIQRAMRFEELRHKLTCCIPRDGKIWDLSSFRPGVRSSVVRGFFIRDLPAAWDTEKVLHELIHSDHVTVCRYVPAGEGTRWRQEVLSPAGGGRVSVAETCCVVPAEVPENQPSTLDIVDSNVFYSFQEAYKVLTECKDVFPESKQLLDLVDRRLETKAKGPFPVVVIEGLDATGKTTLTQSLKESLGAHLLRSPPQCLAPWRSCFDAKPPLIRRAFYALGNYITAGQIAAESARGPVIVDRYWHSTAAYAIATAVRGDVNNLPLPGSEVYRWPGDLLRPDLVLLLTVSAEERLRRIRGRGGEKTREEMELEANNLFRSKVEEAYRRMERPGCVIVDASPPADQVLEQVLLLMKSHL
ncbi:UMP-CMP kinase 2, mitochondrial [Scleropages formosus]|uniref:UMP-CMP kinase 2, mitochondrial n=1 Tax=Scleropages formosus TaxID=113540 RepID=A0A8C9V202_SCLFO|nr:UMP-CMP kinase 2, mitochondrial [Scleropages formosus]